MKRDKNIETSAERYERRSLAAQVAYESLAAQPAITAAQYEAALAGEFGRGMAERFGRLIAPHGLWSEVIDMALSEDDRVAFRASWALEWAYFDDRQAFAPHVSHFFDVYLKSWNGSVHRMYTKMLCDMMRCGILMPDDVQAEQVVEKCFDLLISDDVKTAVKVWCVEVLYDMCPRFDWISEHLAATLNHQIETNPVPAIINHYNKVLRRMANRR